MQVGEPGVDRASLEHAAASAHQRFVQLVAGLTDADAAQVTTGCPGWTAADVAAHVITLFRRGQGDERRSESPEATAALNALCLAEVTDRNPCTIADRIQTDGSTVLANSRLIPDDVVFPFHAGATCTVVSATAVILGELVIHGQDIARATGRDWPIDPLDAALILTGARPLLEHWLDAEGRQMLPGILDSHHPVDVVESIYRRDPPASPALAALIGHLAPI
ncbi:MAG TPA: maleylpyruvate isomerase family mycothiol-dependent enzyme [Streptosporangiaceae bacterium]|nr:maleylpyruvate isomerase family mycothiol-dependent enzyme [Streptosporangiaceae bacterium]